VVILDLSMPGLNGFETASEMRRIAPFTRIILFSIHEIPVSTRAAGAEAFVSKSAGVRPMLATIERLTSPSQQAPSPV
jgi:DNA-binding NarL/FixJ family response regulator